MSSDGVTPTVEFASVALGMNNGVACNVVPGCFVLVACSGYLKKECEIPARQGRATRRYPITRMWRALDAC